MPNDLNLILSEVRYVKERVDKVNDDVSDLKTSVSGLHIEHSRMNDTLVDHVEGVKQNRTRVAAVELGLNTLKSDIQAEKDLEDAVNTAIEIERQSRKERRIESITYWSKKLSIWTGVFTLLTAVITAVGKITGVF